MPEVSIIMPVYNIEKYLPRCLDSIIQQSFSDFELLAVDDGSKDNSLNVLKAYAAKDSRIKVFHQENGGASKARNNGLDHASGRFISFIDGDDFVDCYYIENLYTALIEENALISMCGLVCVDESGKEVEAPFSNNYIPESISGRDAVCQIGRNVTFGVVWNKLYKREIFDSIRFTEGMTFEDEMILHHIYGKVDKISCVRKNLYYYVQRSGSKMKESYSPAKMDIIIAYMDRIEFLLKCGYPAHQVELTNQRLIEFFQTAAVHGLKSKKGRDRFRQLHRIYCDVVVPKLTHRGIKCNCFFRCFPVSYCFLVTLQSRVRRIRKCLK